MTVQPTGLIATRVPRYTSYPTAPHFHSGIDHNIYRGWLAEIEPGLPLSLYCHIPFCDTLCWFCGCHTTVVNRYEPVIAYRDLLLKEIGLVSAALSPDHPVTHIQWGGGSPTMLEAGDIALLSRALRDHFNVTKNCEFAVEIDPRGFSEATAQAFMAAGLTRASIGLQDSDPTVQRAINRIQSNEETARVVTMLRNSGIASINLDLVYGLPHQNIERFRRTAEFALSLDPDRIATFGYAHVPHFKKHQQLIPESALPGIEERLAEAQLARTTFEAAGYRSIGLDHFAKPGDSLSIAQREGRLGRNFQGYTSDNAPALIGLGASAIGSLPQGYAQNIAGVPGYRKALEDGRIPVARGIALTGEDRMRRRIIEKLMCDLRVDLDEVAAEFGRPRNALQDAMDNLRPLERDGAIAITDGVVSVRDEWRSAVRLVCAAFDSYLGRSADRHALAV
ncbi:MAG: oxygen-independent coproporphyrinogen III oxidase [Proteobacteria bacterium]|nr:oxygen-independent coproporphyrinogen III oxidase [Pseudomonadota bacterium]